MSGADDKRPKALKVVVVEINHLPKKDWGTGKCDAFVQLEFEETSVKTQVIEKTYDPIFDEEFVFDVGTDVEGVGDLELKVWDYDKGTKDDLVGTCRISEGDMVRMLRGRINTPLPDEVAEQTLVVINKGKAVTGYDKKTCTVKLQFSIQESVRRLAKSKTRSSGLIDPSSPGGSKKMLEFIVHSVENLPKMDTMGKCDPFIRIHYFGGEYDTAVVKNVYEAFWETKFGFKNDGDLGDARFELLDWNRIGKSDTVGEFVISAKKIGEVLRHDVGYEEKKEYRVKGQEGGEVNGKNGKVCIVKVTARVSAFTEKRLALARSGSGRELKATQSTKDLGRAPSAGGAGAVKKEMQKALRVVLVKGDHMPKMDVGTGKCDPVVELRYGEQRQKSEVKKGTYSPVWNQKFLFEVIDPTRPIGDVEVIVNDWDMGTADDFVGRCHVTSRMIADTLQNLPGWVGKEVTMELVDHHDHTVIGKDREPATVTVRLGVEEIEKKAKAPEPTAAEKAKPLVAQELQLVKNDPQKAAEELVRLKMLLEDKEAARRSTMKVLAQRIFGLEGQRKELTMELDTKGPIADGIYQLVPTLGQPNHYSDLTIEAEAQGEVPTSERGEMREFEAHCNIIWAMCEGLRGHLVTAAGKDLNKGEKHTVYLKWHEVKLEFEGERKGGEEVVEEKKASGKDSHKEHDWDPKTCVSVPGSVQGVPMRCSCAHGAFSGLKGIGKLCPRCMGKMDGSGGDSSQSSGPVKFRIVGALPSVIAKVLTYIYSARCEPPFTDKEVPDAILVSKHFGLIFLLEHLFRQKWFPRYGIAMWEAARHIADTFGSEHTDSSTEGDRRGGEKAAALSKKWFGIILTNKFGHFDPDKVWPDDGAKYLSLQGFKMLLSSEMLNVEEIFIFKCAMLWGKERLRRHQAAEAKWEEDKENARDPTVLAKVKVIKWAFKDASSEVMRAVRFPFISIDSLNTTVSMDPDYMKGNFCDASNIPLVLRAVFQQNGQTFPTVDPDVSWRAPRVGSIHYNGEWEWRYCKSAFQDQKRMWPVKEAFREDGELLNMSWMTDEQIRQRGWSKVEIFNLILPEATERDTSLRDVINSFLFIASRSQLQGVDSFQHRSEIDQVLRGGQADKGADKIKKQVSAFLGNKQARMEKAKDALRAHIKQLVEEERRQGAIGGRGGTRGLLAVGRVRKSFTNNGLTDPRLHGHCFLIFDNLADARDVILHYNNRPFFRAVMKPGGLEPDRWEQVGNDNQLLRIKLAGADPSFNDQGGTYQDPQFSLQRTVTKGNIKQSKRVDSLGRSKS